MKTIIITGAGSGIGKATAIEISKVNDVRLVLVGRRQLALEETQSQCDRAQDHHVLQMDIRDKLAWRRFFSEQNELCENICGIFANAGEGGENHYGEADRWDELLSINLTGTYTTIMELLPFLEKAKEKFRQIAITSSCLGRFVYQITLPTALPKLVY